MITLWHCVDARSFRTLWALEELKLPYQLIRLPFPPRERARDYLQINPLGTIPAMRDGDTFMTESAATVQYLVTKYGPSELAVAADDPAYGAWLNWLHFGEATLTFPQTLVLRYTQLEPVERRQPQVADDYARWFLSRARQVERALGTAKHLCAGRFTAADISVGYAFLLASVLKLDDKLGPLTRGYWATLKDRPAFLRAAEAQYEPGQPKTGLLG
jgi:glutathione S-transferase